MVVNGIGSLIVGPLNIVAVSVPVVTPIRWLSGQLGRSFVHHIYVITGAIFYNRLCANFFAKIFAKISSERVYVTLLFLQASLEKVGRVK